MRFAPFRRLRSGSTAVVLLMGAALAPATLAEVERINVEELGRLPAFSHATVASGQLVFVAGTLGTQPRSSNLVEGGVGAQTRQALGNIERILTEAGTTKGEVLQCTVYLTDMTKFAEMNEAWIPFFQGRPPARATIGVAALALGAAVEIECVAQRTIAPAAASR